MSVDARLQAIDPDWLGEILGAAVGSVAVDPVAFAGATTDMARLKIEYDAGATGPASLIAKIRGAEEMQIQMDAAMGLFEREGRFYEELATEVPMGTPACVHVGDGTTTPLLLEDLAGLRMGDQMDGLTLADAEAAIDALGDLHAAFWESPALDAPWLASPATGVFAGMICQLVASGAPALAEQFGGQVPDSVLEAVVDQAPDWARVLERAAEGPQTLVHNDARLDNLFFTGDGAPIFIDWQLVARTRGAQDVGYLLAGSMDSADLAASWEPLLHRYHDRLVAGGVSGYSFDELLDHYRVNILYPLGAGMALLGSMDIGDGRGLGEAIVLRALRHVADLDSFALL